MAFRKVLVEIDLEKMQTFRKLPVDEQARWGRMLLSCFLLLGCGQDCPVG